MPLVPSSPQLLARCKSGENETVSKNAKITAFIGLVISLAGCAEATEEFTFASLQTPSGEIRGTVIDDVERFRGIPYAKKPVGELRFAPAQLNVVWDGTLEAFQPGSVCPQDESVNFLAPDAVMSEDCLYLDIYKPAGDQVDLPVLFWIHGGGYTLGSGDTYDGSVLARQGPAIIVSINYRLGLLGFTDTSSWGAEFNGSHNNGIGDQIVALRWVKRNIKEFGGNPDRVTIFGESAGAGSVLALLSSPEANGLFAQAISHSPPPICDQPSDLLSFLSERMGESKSEIKTLLANSSWAEIIEIQKELVDFPFAACIDEDVIFSDKVAEQRGINLSQAPLIVGSNKDEGTFFTELFALADTFGADGGEALTVNLAKGMGKDENVSAYLEYVKSQHADKKDLSTQIWNDFFHSAVAKASRRAVQRNSDVWVYRFDLPSSRNPFGTILGLAGIGNDLGATHASEIELTFNYFDLPDDKNMFHEKNNAMAASLAEKWSGTILKFAISGDPNGAGLPTWPEFSATEKIALAVDAESHTVSAPHEQIYSMLHGDAWSISEL